MKIVLASQSPRRRELLGKMGLEFTTKAPEIDETALSGLPAAVEVAPRGELSACYEAEVTLCSV